MREHTEHTSQAGNAPSATETDLGTTLLRQAATALEEEHAETAAFSLVRQALAIRQTPAPQELAELTDSLLTHCASLAVGVQTIPARQRPARGAGALRDWAQLQADGPADGPLGPWSYARQLALVARNMLQAICDHRGTALERAAYVGRPSLPPLAPSSR
ncbi:DUF6415 family natural product biosynthesis protein [Streptomyces sp. NPDC056488]|uniref:DUF6415 family natural product biosynthesis protein n=1 Tax=Streptomyces sp. NPDC056488 TaxID=3345836 RepID=UPI00369CC425